MPSVPMVTLSLYTPGDTRTRSPFLARSTAAWIVSASAGTRMVRPDASIVGAARIARAHGFDRRGRRRVADAELAALAAGRRAVQRAVVRERPGIGERVHVRAAGLEVVAAEGLDRVVGVTLWVLRPSLIQRTVVPVFDVEPRRVEVLSGCGW